MKVSDLIEMLEDFNPEAEVLFAYNYGDYWRTTVAARIDSVEDAKVVYSDYHSMDKVVMGHDEPEDEGPAGTRNVVLLG